MEIDILTLEERRKCEGHNNDNVDTLLSVVGIGCLVLHCLTKKYNI